ncbi:MAG TPA: glycosyltransferase family 4 protein [Candidatus Polarisedimenticolaceae bacterium]|nr:glycosyltransferase family 4 protein [Candidatus Polarisedimenticolaceae bacterium]
MSPGSSRPDRTLLVLSQVYVPDPASVGQHVADAAAEMARRGWRVLVLTADRGYDDPRQRYPRRERRDGVDVRRLPWCSFGKRSIAVRLLGGVSFLIQSIVRGLFTRRLQAILVSTSPPMCAAAALVIGTLRRVPIKYWVMDLNPDQMIALGKLAPNALAARGFDAFNRLVLARAADVIALDRFMAERLVRKRDVRAKLTILPPWPHEDHVEPVAHADNPFRERHGLAGKFVVMYSGNHGPSNPLSTILRAAERLRDDADLLFLFVGGGIGKREIDEAIAAGAPNVRSLPYQPLAELRYSLSAGDVHLVSVGDAVVGIVHPCKVYGAMAVSRPVLLLGPIPCHVSELLDRFAIGRHIAHGDVDGAVQALRGLRATSAAELAAMGRRARAAVAGELGKSLLCKQFCDVLERGLPAAAPHRASVVRS